MVTIHGFESKKYKNYEDNNVEEFKREIELFNYIVEK